MSIITGTIFDNDNYAGKLETAVGCGIANGVMTGASSIPKRSGSIITVIVLDDDYNNAGKPEPSVGWGITGFVALS